MTRQHRHPAQASRIVATGLSAATMLGIVAALGATTTAGTPDGAAKVAPAKVSVVVRAASTAATGWRQPPPRAPRPPDTTTRPS